MLAKTAAAKPEDVAASFAQQPAMPGQLSQAEGSATSIIGILEVVETDFTTDLAKEETEEAEAQGSYDAVKDQTASFVQQPAMPGQPSQATGSVTSIIGTMEVAEAGFAKDFLTRDYVRLLASRESLPVFHQAHSDGGNSASRSLDGRPAKSAASQFCIVHMS